MNVLRISDVVKQRILHGKSPIIRDEYNNQTYLIYNKMRFRLEKKILKFEILNDDDEVLFTFNRTILEGDECIINGVGGRMPITLEQA